MKYIAPLLWALTWPAWLPLLGIMAARPWLTKPNEFLLKYEEVLVILIAIPALGLGIVWAVP